MAATDLDTGDLIVGLFLTYKGLSLTFSHAVLTLLSLLSIVQLQYPTFQYLH